MINPTSTGLHATDVEGAGDAGVFAPAALAGDLIYADEPTLSVRWARANPAARTPDGAGMLIEELAESFPEWRRVRPGPVLLLPLLRPV